jgi:hypothetical protein
MSILEVASSLQKDLLMGLAKEQGAKSLLMWKLVCNFGKQKEALSDSLELSVTYKSQPRR